VPNVVESRKHTNVLLYRSELNAPSLAIKNGPVWVRLSHQLALCFGTRVGIGSFNGRESGSDWTLKAEIPSLGPMLRLLPAQWQAE
jgi:hypothetical protein